MCVVVVKVGLGMGRTRRVSVCVGCDDDEMLENWVVCWLRWGRVVEMRWEGGNGMEVTGQGRVPI